MEQEGEGRGIPGVGNDDVVEGRVGAPKARKPDLDHHFWGRIWRCGAAGRGDAALVLQLSRTRFDVGWVHGPVDCKFWALQLLGCRQMNQSDAPIRQLAATWFTLLRVTSGAAQLHQAGRWGAAGDVSRPHSPPLAPTMPL